MAGSRDVERELRDFSERAMRLLQANIYQALITACPVDVGWARAFFVPSVGEIRATQRPRPGVRRVAQAQADAAFRRNQQSSASIRRSYTLRQGPIFIVNPVEYVGFLNEGTSAQAPARWIEAAVEQGIVSTRSQLGA